MVRRSRHGCRREGSTSSTSAASQRITAYAPRHWTRCARDLIPLSCSDLTAAVAPERIPEVSAELSEAGVAIDESSGGRS